MSARTHPTWALTLILVLAACTPPTPVLPTATATPPATATTSPTVAAPEAARPLAWPTATAFYDTPEPGQALAVFESAVTI